MIIPVLAAFSYVPIFAVHQHSRAVYSFLPIPLVSCHPYNKESTHDDTKLLFLNTSFREITLAPLSSKSMTTNVCPPSAARCNGVFPACK